MYSFIFDFFSRKIYKYFENFVLLHIMRAKLRAPPKPLSAI